MNKRRKQPTMREVLDRLEAIERELSAVKAELHRVWIGQAPIQPLVSHPERPWRPFEITC